MIQKFFVLSGVRKKLVCQAALLQVMVRVAFSLFPFQRVYRWFDRPIRMISKENRPHEQEIVWAVLAAAGKIPRTTCLTNALVARFLLSHYGIRSRLHIGIAKKRDRLDAHAWLTIAGTVVIGEVENMEKFTVLPEISIENS